MDNFGETLILFFNYWSQISLLSKTTPPKEMLWATIKSDVIGDFQEPKGAIMEGDIIEDFED